MKFPFLAYIVGAAHADETAFFQVVFFFGTQRDGIDQHGEVVRIAADHLDELVLASSRAPYR